MSLCLVLERTIDWQASLLCLVLFPSVAEQEIGASCERLSRATCGIFFRVYFLKMCARPSCSLSRSFEKRCARPSCSLSRSIETRFHDGSLCPSDRGGSPDGLAISFRLQLAELSQLAQISSGLLAQPTCARVRTPYAESSGFGAALRTPVVLGHWLVDKRGPTAVQRGREPLRIPTVCVEHKSRLWATADHLRRERRRGQGLVRLAGEPRAARIRRGESYVNQTQQSRLAQ